MLTEGTGERNALTARRIERAPVRDPLRFVVAGDSGAGPTRRRRHLRGAPRADRRARSRPGLLRQSRRLRRPGTRARHEHYLRLVDPLPIPDICVVGNHDLDDEDGAISGRVLRAFAGATARLTFGADARQASN